MWFRHDQENFEDYNREQFFGHGNPFEGTAGSPNQLHWQFEKSGNIRTLTVDGTDETMLTCSYCNGNRSAIEASTGEPCGDNRACWAPYRGHTDTLASQHGAVDNGAMWHMLTLTTNPDGSRGYSTYLDGQMRASMPYAGMGVDIFDTDPDGNWERASNVRLGRPIDPEGPMRLCGRLANYGDRYGADEQSHWSQPGVEPANKNAGWHPNRYFMGKVAHASFFSHAMTKEQVNALMQGYVEQYKLPVTPFDLPAGIAQPVAYYALDEGSGFELKESVSGKTDAGKVIYDAEQQSMTYDQPNWVNVRRAACARHAAASPCACTRPASQLTCNAHAAAAVAPAAALGTTTPQHPRRRPLVSTAAPIPPPPPSPRRHHLNAAALVPATPSLLPPPSQPAPRSPRGRLLASVAVHLPLPPPLASAAARLPSPPPSPKLPPWHDGHPRPRPRPWHLGRPGRYLAAYGAMAALAAHASLAALAAMSAVVALGVLASVGYLAVLAALAALTIVALCCPGALATLGNCPPPLPSMTHVLQMLQPPPLPHIPSDLLGRHPSSPASPKAGSPHPMSRPTALAHRMPPRPSTLSS